MENRDQVVADYFKLRVLLNRTNLKSNQKTEIQLLSQRKNLGTLGLVLMATLKGIENGKAIELCHKEHQSPWRPSEYSGLFYLEAFCASFLERDRAGELAMTIQKLDRELRGLGISR